MALPNAKMKTKKVDGVIEYTFTDEIDAANYTLNELTRGALYDVARYLRRQVGEELYSFWSGRFVKNYGRTHVRHVDENRTGKLLKKYMNQATQKWVGKKYCDLQIGFKENSWYGTAQELGARNYPKLGILKNTAYKNIDKIRDIESRYLDGMNNEKPFEPTINTSDD